MAGGADVDRDDLHRLADRHDGKPGLLGDPVGGAVAGAGLVGVDALVGHQVHRRALDARDVAVDDHGAVHLGQLAQAGGGERHVESEATGAQRLDRLVVAQHDQGPGAAAQDALQPVAERGPRRDRGQRRAQAQALVGALDAGHGVLRW